MGEGRGGEDGNSGKEEPTAERWAWSLCQGRQRGLSLPRVPPSGSVFAPPLSLATAAGAGDQKELPAGQEGGWRLVCANPGPRSSEGPGNFKEGKAELYCRRAH